MVNVFNSVLDYSLKNPEGFTFNIETLKPVKFGISVAYLETQNAHGLVGFEKAYNHALEHEKIIGGWLNEENSLYHFDSVRIFPNHEMSNAIEFAKQNLQIAIFDLTNLKLIMIE